MRCHYLSDLHLELQDFPWKLPHGDVLIIAGDLCHARCLDPARTDRYSINQRDRVRRFTEMAVRNFAHVLLVAGNHDHYDGIFDETAGLLGAHLPGVTVLDDSHVEIGSVRFFGATLWTDLGKHDPVALNAIRRGMGEYFFVKKRTIDAQGQPALAKFQPDHAAAAFARAWAALRRSAAEAGKRTVIVTHHAPSLKGRNPAYAGNVLDAAYFSDLDHEIAGLTNVPVWVHGHTHIVGSYRIGATTLHVNCRGTDGKDASSRAFSAGRWFELK